MTANGASRPFPRAPEGLLTEPTADAQPWPWERVLMLRVFGRLPDTGVSERTEAGVRKASGEETAGELSPAVLSGYGDLAREFDLIGDCEQGRRPRR